MKLPSLSGHKAVGRTHIRQVAEKRSHELTGYVKHLLQLKEVSEVSRCATGMDIPVLKGANCNEVDSPSLYCD